MFDRRLRRDARVPLERFRIELRIAQPVHVDLNFARIAGALHRDAMHFQSVNDVAPCRRDPVGLRAGNG